MKLCTVKGDEIIDHFVVVLKLLQIILAVSNFKNRTIVSKHDCSLMSKYVTSVFFYPMRYCSLGKVLRHIL